MNSQPTSFADTPYKGQDTLREMLTLAAELLQTEPAAIDADEPLGYLGFDSASLKLFATRLSQRFGTQIDTVLLFTYPTLRLLCDHIAEQSTDNVTREEPTASRLGQSNREVASDRDIAIVGIACRLPSAATKEAFWDNQAACHNAIREIPKRRWDWKALFGDPLREAGRTDVKWGGFIEGEDQFAPDFFGISVYEAELMDPQHRLFLKAAWEAIWDAGYDPSGFAGRSVGVFAGVQFQDYQKLLDAEGLQSAQACTGNAHAMLANRVSFMLDVHGPSEAIDTACSSSLVAIHNAVRAIRLGECELAIAGGVNLLLTPDVFIMGRQLGVLSPSGQCRTFDAGADGYVRGEGVGALLLKPLGDAIRDRDQVYAVIKGTAVNHGGKAASLTAPNSRAQADLIIRALKDAGLTPNDVSYVEMHGTGTELGDPIEVEGVKSAFRKLRAEHGLAPSPCAIGSVKTNIGHLEPAAGVAGVINAVMAIAHRNLPGLSNFRARNPHIQLEDGFAIQTKTGAWPEAQAGKPLGALVNSFGFGGANASTVLMEHRPEERALPTVDAVYIPVSAGTPQQLLSYAEALVGTIAALSPQAGVLVLRDIAFTLQSRNDTRADRAVVQAATLAELIGGLQAIATGGVLPAGVMAGPGRPAAGWPDHVMQWLETGRTQWPDVAGAKRRSLPVPPWPDKACWFKPRAVDAHADEQPARMTYLEPFWQPAEAGAGRKLDDKCIWIVGRSDDQAEHFEALLRSTLPRKATLITSIIETGNTLQPPLAAWNLAGDDPDIVVILPAEDESTSWRNETAVFFAMAKTLMEHAFNHEVDLFFLAHEDFGISPALDALSALAKSAFLENERLRLHSLFLGRRGDQDWHALAAREIALEPPPIPATIRFEGGRAVRGLRKIDLEQPRQARSWFQSDGVYLFAGGAGELGYRLLERLVAETDATFTVCGRSALDGKVAEVIDLLRQKARSTDRVDYVQCDIADLRQTRAMVDAIMKRHGRLDGVVNMVTAHNDAYIFRKSWEDFAAVSTSKVEGTINLDQATAHIGLDFFVVFSSLASLGLAGGSDYAYGCAFQNAFTDWRSRAVANGQRHGASHAINWSRWQWDKYVTTDFDDWFATLGYAFLDIDTGLDAWRAIMEGAGAEIFALNGWTERIFSHLNIKAGLLRSTQAKVDMVKPAEPRRHTAALTPVAASTSQAATGSASPRQDTVAQKPVTGCSKGQPTGRLEDALAGIVRDLLKLDALDPRSPFPSIGLDSVMAIRLIVLVEQRLSRRLTPKELLQYPSVAALADYMLSHETKPDLKVFAPTDGLDEVMTFLTSSLRRMLRADEISANARFRNLGVDSIMAVKLATEFNKQFPVGISPRWFIDFPSIDHMAREIETRRSARPSAVLSSE